MRRYALNALMIFLLLIVTLCGAALAEDRQVYAAQGNVAFFKENGKVGLQSTDGIILHAADFDGVGYFDEYGLAEIRIGDRKGKIRMDGEVVVPPIHCNSIGFLHYQHTGYTEIYDEALLFITMQNNKAQYGFYSLDGRLITEACWDKAYGFKNGIAYVQQNGKWNMINMAGELLLDDWWDDLYIDRNTVALATDSKKVLMDMNGIVLAEHSYKNGKWVLSTLSQQVLPSEVECEYVMKVSNGYYYQVGSKWGMMDENASVICPLQWDQVTSTQDENYFLVKNNGKTGLLDQSGNLMIDSIYDNISYITTDRWIVRKESFAAVMDNSGNIIKDLSSENYVVLYPVGNGYIQYETDSDQWGFMDSDGTVLSCVDGNKIQPDPFGQYSEGWIEIEMMETDEVGYMYIDGTILSSADWGQTKPFSQGYAAVLLNSTGKWTHITRSGDRAYDQEWDTCGEFIMGMDGPVAQVIQKTDNQDRKFGYIDIHGNLLNGLSSM